MAASTDISADRAATWPQAIYRTLKTYDIRHVAYVPDGGHADLIEQVWADGGIEAVPLTTEEEGVALLAGSWLGGRRGVLLLQSSGVGNCINMLSLVKTCKFPFFALVTMRGEWGEFNPWQVPMGSTTQSALQLMDIKVLRAEQANEVEDTVAAAAKLAFLGGTPAVVLLSQRLIGSKVFVK